MHENLMMGCIIESMNRPTNAEVFNFSRNLTPFIWTTAKREMPWSCAQCHAPIHKEAYDAYESFHWMLLMKRSFFN